MDLIDRYEILLNKISYKTRIEAFIYKVNVQGLAGGKKYEVTVKCYPKDRNLVPQESNPIVILEKK